MITNRTLKMLDIKGVNEVASVSGYDAVKFMPYKGNLKSKVKLDGKFVKREDIAEDEFWFCASEVKDGVWTCTSEFRFEFVKLVQTEELPHWAFRVFDCKKEEYCSINNVLFALNFIK